MAKVIFVSEVKTSKFSPHDLIENFSLQGCHVVRADGISGGLWLLWTEDVDIEVVKSSPNYILANVSFKCPRFVFRLVCLYGDPYHVRTNDIWSEVVAFVNVDNSPLFCMGDLNDLLNSDEKIGVAHPNYNRISSLRTIINNCGLFDLGYNGPAYTWTNRRFSSNPTFERLDRCLANVAWCRLFPNTNVYHLPLIYGDHAPILAIPTSNRPRKKRMFKFENWWLYENDFQEVSREAWQKSADMPFYKRTKHLGFHLQRWSRKGKASLNNQLRKIEGEIANLQSLPPNSYDYSFEDKLIHEHACIQNKISEYYRQRCKKRWVTQGDRNTSFFHNSVIKRRRKNRISSIKNLDGSSATTNDQIAKCFINFFSGLFESNLQGMELVPDILVSNIIRDENLIAAPSKEEILNILKSMRRNAAPGPDGLNVVFYRTAWSWIGDDVHDLVKSFYMTKHLPQGIKKTNIVLIPKKVTCSTPMDYRPISLCNVVYKIIAKSLSLKLQPYMPTCINSSQYAFVKGRRITENIIIAHEIFHTFNQKKWNDCAFMLKLDLAKAFDRLEWIFIKQAMYRMGFDRYFIELVSACIEWPTFSVIINGEAFGNFQSSRGIRQGCPLSPYLFIIAINELICRLQDAVTTGAISGIRLTPQTPPIHSLLFADDVLICGQATMQEAQVIKDILISFCNDSGQVPNWSKSSILFSTNTPMDTRENIKSLFQVPLMDHNSTHLGHPLFTSHIPKSKVYAFLKNKFKAKLSDWKADNISHPGRTTLIKSVFSSIPIYYMSHILFPKTFTDELTRIIRHFWWKGNNPDNSKKPLCLSSWDYLCIPKGVGGLGIRDLAIMNEALITGLAWRMLDEPNTLWARILKGKYFPHTSFWRANTQGSKSWTWESILKVRKHLINAVHWQLFDGDVSIWNEPWCPMWGNIYNFIKNEAMCSNLPIKVSELWLREPKRWNIPLINHLFGPNFANHILQIPLSQSDGQDILIWKPNKSGRWTAQSAYKLIHEGAIQKTVSKVNLSLEAKAVIDQIWKNKKILPRVQMFIWRLMTKNIANAQRVNRRINKIPATCSRCNQVENDEHLFFHCNFSRAVWFASPLGIRTDNLQGSCAYIVNFIFSHMNLSENVDLACYILWHIWKARNDLKFQNKSCSIHSVIIRAKGDLKAQYSAYNIEQFLFNDQVNNDPAPSGQVEDNLFLDDNCHCKTDASFHHNQETGLGIYFANTSDQSPWALQIQAKTTCAASPLHAEALSLYLGMLLASILQVEDCVFFTDCLPLAQCINTTGDDVPEWTTRPIIRDIKNIKNQIHGSCHHIPRESNIVADSLARNAGISEIGTFEFRCSNVSHIGACPFEDKFCKWPSWAKLCMVSCI